MGSSQGKIAGSSLPDRISDLPSNIIDCILDRIPIRDAVATSILCQKWRHNWRRIPSLVFDKKFADDFVCRRTRGEPAMLKHEYSNIIGKIMLLHVGPVHKFVLHIPYFCTGKSPLDLSSWMLFISQNEVKELTIEDKHTPKFRLPLYVFQCNELQILKLDVCALELHPAQDFRGFCNLHSLDLSGILEGDEISNFVSKCPVLESLSLNRKACRKPLVIDALKCPLLERLSVHILDFGLPWFVDAPRIRFLYASIFLDASLELKNVCSVTAISLMFGVGRPVQLYFSQLLNIFNLMPEVETATLRSLHYIVDVPRNPLQSIPVTLHNLKNLTLLDIGISSKAPIYFIVCMLRCSPNLRKLNLGIYPLAPTVDEAALHFLDTQIREPQTLNSLSTVKIKGLMGSKVEILFIKLILSWSTVLKTLHLTGVKSFENQTEFTLFSELLQWPRPSCQAQVIYSKHPGDSSIFDF